MRYRLDRVSADYQQALGTIESLKAELSLLRATKAWRWTLRARKFRAELIFGRWPERKRYLQEMLSRFIPGWRSSEGIFVSPQERRFARRLEDFLERVEKDTGADRFVCIFSGTREIQPKLGNRPMRMAAVLRERGIPVFFSYYRFDTREPLPEGGDPLLFQSPIDKTVAALKRLAYFKPAGKRRLFVASFPHLECARWANVLKTLGWEVLYECRDDWEEFYRVGVAPWYDSSIESYLVNNCDASLCTAVALQEKMQGYGPDKKVGLSPNALDRRFLSKENCGRTAPRSGPPVIGYFGHLTDKWFAWEMLKAVAEREPEWKFELIGHGLEAELSLPKNMQLLGSKDHAEINRIAKRWRAAIIPFAIGRLSDAVDPIKVYEYLALGLPVVCLRMRQIEHYPYIFPAQNAEEFRSQLQRAMAEPMDRNVIDEFLAHNRWEDRVDQLLAVADETSRSDDPLGGLGEVQTKP